MPADVELPIGVYTVYSTQNAEQAALAERFAAVTLATQPAAGPRVPVRSTELQGLQRDDGAADTFRSPQWYRVLVRKVTHWAALAEQHPGRLLLCSDNDITLLPGWRDALLRSYVDAGRPDLCFQREGGDDPFFAAIPYNSGFFLMNGTAQAAVASDVLTHSRPLSAGSAAAAAFWRHVAARTERERPFTGDQAVVNSLLVARQVQPPPWPSRSISARAAACGRSRGGVYASSMRRGAIQPALRWQADGEPGCTANPLELRHAHFPPRLVHGGCVRRRVQPTGAPAEPATTCLTRVPGPRVAPPTSPFAPSCGSPTVPGDDALREYVRVHHATASGGARGKLRALERLLDAWLAAAGNRTRGELGLPAPAAWIEEEGSGVT
jgi:hypothetical protein